MLLCWCCRHITTAVPIRSAHPPPLDLLADHDRAALVVLLTYRSTVYVPAVGSRAAPMSASSSYVRRLHSLQYDNIALATRRKRAPAPPCSLLRRNAWRASAANTRPNAEAENANPPSRPSSRP